MPSIRSTVLLGLLLCASAPSYAHSPLPGIEGFYVGVLDPFLAAPQILALATLGLLIAGFQNHQAAWFLGTFLVSSLGGIIFGAGFPMGEMILLLAATGAGTWTCIAAGRGPVAAMALVAGTGAVLGAVSIPDPGPLNDRMITVSGSFAGLNIGLLYIAGGVLMARERFPATQVAKAQRLAALILGCAAALLLLHSSELWIARPDG